MAAGSTYDAAFSDALDNITRLQGQVSFLDAAAQPVPVGGITDSVTGDSSYQTVSADLTVAATAGDNTDTHYFGAAMFNLFGATLTKTKNYLGGVIGAYSITGTKATTYPAGAVLAQITDGVTEADGAVVAYIDGDSAQTNCGAMFKVRNNNSTVGSGPDFGVDLQDAAHDGFQPVNAAFYKKAPVRIVGDVCLLVGSGDPVNGTTGDNVCGPGSLYFDTSITTKAVYVNTGAIDNPTWTALY